MLWSWGREAQKARPLELEIIRVTSRRKRWRCRRDLLYSAELCRPHGQAVCSHCPHKTPWSAHSVAITNSSASVLLPAHKGRTWAVIRGASGRTSRYTLELRSLSPILTRDIPLTVTLGWKLFTPFYPLLTSSHIFTRPSSIMGGKFEPKEPVNLDPPKSDPISLEDLAKANGTNFYVISPSVTCVDGKS